MSGVYCSFPCLCWAVPEQSLDCVSVNLKCFEMGSVYAEAKVRLLMHDTSAGGSLKKIEKTLAQMSFNAKRH